MSKSPEQVAFYRSREWEETREAYMETVGRVCERCGRAGKVCHHRRYITSENVCDPTFTLSFANLECLCQTCHNEEHHGGGMATADGLRFDERGNLVSE